MKKCTECGQKKLIAQFDIKRGKPRSNCKTCVRAYGKQHYLKNRNYYLIKATRNRIKAKRKLRQFIYDYYKAHSCVVCGESDPVVLEFDHLREKYKGIAIMVNRALSLTRIEAEIAKCEVVCANCHKRRTAKKFNWYKNLE